MSIESFGFNVPIVCDERLRILAGHTRREAALRLGLKTVPVVIVKIAKQRQTAFSIADNQTATIAQWDDAGLRSVLESIKKQKVRLDSLGFSQAQLDSVLAIRSDFPWALFDKEMTAGPEKLYGLLRVKIPRAALKQVRNAMRAFAIRAGIHESDAAVLAGKVLMSSLAVEANDEQAS
jgi:hypothetical protein